jgi:hypothetical protein
MANHEIKQTIVQQAAEPLETSKFPAALMSAMLKGSISWYKISP